MTWLHDFLANQATAQSAGNAEVYPPIRTGPQNAIRATSPASPYARDRIEAPSNRPAPRTPTLRSRTQDVIRSAPGALSAARERQVYDTTWEDVGRGAQELTGLPSLARGAGGLAALPALARSGFLGADHALPIAGAVAETALGLAGPMSLPRGALRAPTAEAVSPFGRQITGRTSEYMNEVRRLPRLSGRARQAFAEAQGTAGVVETIPFSQLSTYQDVINPDFVAAAARHTPDDMPRVYRYRGKNYVMDGNHRLAATAGTGVDSAQVRVYDLDARLRGEPAPQGPVRESQAAFGPNGQPVEPAQRIPNMAREIGPNGMPIAQPQPYRNSLRGGSGDLREAAGMGAPSVASESYPISLLWEGDNIGYNGPWSAWDVTQRPVSSLDIRLAQITGAREVRPHSAAPNTDWTPQDHARRIATLMRERPADPITIRRIGDNEPMRNADGSVDYAPQVIDGKHRLAAARMRGDRNINVQWEQPRTPPPTTPTGTAPFGDPRAYPQSAWEEFGSLQGGTPEARLRAQEPPPREGPPSLVDLVDDGGGNLIVGAMRRAGVNIQRAEDSGLLDRPMTQRQIPITQLRGTDHTRPAREWVDMFKEDPSEFYPIQVRQRGRNRYDIIDGHHRTQAAREMGQTEIDAYDASLYFPEIRNRWALGAPLAAVPPSGSALTQQQNTTGRPRGRPGFFGGR